MSNQNRRTAFRRILATLLGTTGLAAVARAATPSTDEKETFNTEYHQEIPLFSGSTKHKGLVFIAGKGAHFEGDIKAHTDHVIKEVEKELIAAGSSMDKVLKVNVYLADLKDYQGMNEVFRGRFGPKPPVRTTIAAFGGIPGNSLVEMDCIAYTR